MFERIGLDPASLPSFDDPAQWGPAKEILTANFRSRPRDAWIALLEGSDSSVAPVLSLAEEPPHPHLRARGTFIAVDGIVHPAPAPRFSPTKPDPPRTPAPKARQRGVILATRHQARAHMTEAETQARIA